MIFILILISINAFTKKEVSLQRFVITVSITYHMVLKKIIFPPQTFVVTLKNTQFFCSYCSRIKHCLYHKIKKACILASDKKNIAFNIYTIDLYLHEKIKASPLFYFDKTKNEVILRLNNIDYDDFSISRYCKFLIEIK